MNGHCRSWEEKSVRRQRIGLTLAYGHHAVLTLLTSDFETCPMKSVLTTSSTLSSPRHLLLSVTQLPTRLGSRAPSYCFIFQSISLKTKTFFKRFYLFIFREGTRGRKRGGETLMCGCLSSAPYWGPGPKPRHMPCVEIEPATVWFTDRCLIPEPH